MIYILYHLLFFAFLFFWVELFGLDDRKEASK